MATPIDDDSNTALAAAILDTTASAMILLSPQLEIRYLNTAALKALQAVQDALPFRAGDASGKSFALVCDAAQLRDRSQLPWSTVLTLGTVEIEIDARALYVGGDYVGPLLSWSKRGFGGDKRAEIIDLKAQREAIRRSQLVIEFTTEGIVTEVNDLFLAAVGYAREELVGRHHGALVDPEYRESAEYKQFWRDLAAGKTQQGEFRRFNKAGEEVWLQAYYTPIGDGEGNTLRVVKYATDITSQKRQAAEIRRLSEAAQEDAHELQSRVNEMLAVVADAAEGDLTRSIDIVGEDAIGQMADGLGRLLGDLRTSIGSIAEHASEVGAASNQLTNLSQQMAAAADETSAQVSVVNEAAADVSSNVATVAAGIEELGASMRDISKNATEAAKIATRGVQVAADTNNSVAELGEAGREIGKIVKLITAIAQQTNLLALNATIEAARAGEAGRGFAVVANEVKELAKETSTATDDISQRILAIQSSTDAAVMAIGQISEIIDRINEFQSAIAAAVEQQSATTSSISRNISEAARRSSEIAENITAVAGAAKNTAAAAGDTQNAANQLDEMANSLQKLVSAFKLN